jgi:hypothetical protein
MAVSNSGRRQGLGLLGSGGSAGNADPLLLAWFLRILDFEMLAQGIFGVG